jgi:5'-AMP-activated protein kinase catalytic alpha subunit
LDVYFYPVTKEIEILRSFASLRVIKLHDVIETSKAFYVVMEYCENGELVDYIILKGRLQEDEARQIFRQVNFLKS